MKKRRKVLDFAGLYGGAFGVPGEIRTHGLPLRRRTLYPTELRRLVLKKTPQGCLFFGDPDGN